LLVLEGTTQEHRPGFDRGKLAEEIPIEGCSAERTSKWKGVGGKRDETGLSFQKHRKRTADMDITNNGAGQGEARRIWLREAEGGRRGILSTLAGQKTNKGVDRTVLGRYDLDCPNGELQ